MVRVVRLERTVSWSQTTRATNCANPGFLVIEFCTRCGQTCGQAVFLTTSTCGGSAFIVGVSRDCGHSIFQLEGGATRSQTRRDTNFATPGYSVPAMIPRRTVKIKFFLSVVILHFSHPTMPRGKKQQEAGDFLPAFCCFFAKCLKRGFTNGNECDKIPFVRK